MLLPLVILCFTLSGFAALLYQTAWIRLFAIAFGTSEIAVAVVLAGYMGGLAVGAALAARYVAVIRRPVLVYGLLEGGIAIAALAMPLMVNASGQLYAFFVGGQPAPPDAGAFGQPLYYSIASLLVLLVPTVLMGATLPLLAKFVVTSNRNLGGRVSLLYSMNTFGAVGGVLAAGFILLPAFGLRGTVWFGVLTNFIVFIIAVLLARRVEGSRVDRQAEPPDDETESTGVRFILPLIALSGALSFVYEVLWTRMLSHVLGSSIYAFATMLSAFLTGIAIGAAAAGTVAKNPRRATLLFAASQFAIAVASAFVYWHIEQTVPSGISYALFAFAVILPSSIFIGATYPLAVRSHAGGVADVGRSSAIVYSWNTVGAILGALLAGFIIIPMLGFAGTARIAVVANLCIGLIALVLCTRVASWRPIGHVQPTAALIVVLGTVFLFHPSRPDAVVMRTHFGGSGESTVQEIYYSVGRTSTVLLTENEARFDLSTNGLPEAQVEFRGAPPMVLSQRWLGLWPNIIRPDAESMLVVGLGGGVVLEGVPESIETLHVVELEAEVVVANQLIGKRRINDPLLNSHLAITINDARNALRLTSRKYDAIVSQPSHPWTAGASHLFTREFFALVSSRLNQDGVFVQWMNAEFLDEALLRQLAATLLAEFENVRIYQPSALALHFIASNGPIGIEHQLQASGRPLIDDPLHYGRNGINSMQDMAVALLVDEQGIRELAGELQPITDDDNRMAVDSNVEATGLGVQRLTEITAAADPLLDSNSWLRREMSDADIAYIAWRLLYDAQLPRFNLLLDTIERQATRDVLQAMLARYHGNEAEALRLATGIGAGEPVFQQAVFLRTIDHLQPATQDAVVAESLLALDAEDTSLNAVLRGWQALVAADWQQLSELESRLASSGPVDLWAPFAARLRAEWRLHLDEPGGDLVHEALDLADQALLGYATPSAYALRAEIGLKLGDDSVFVESVAFLLRAINNRLWGVDYYGESLAPTESKWIADVLENFAAELRQLRVLDDSGRADIVLAQLLELQGYLVNY
jgi:spermidine synthase